MENETKTTSQRGRRKTSQASSSTATKAGAETETQTNSKGFRIREKIDPHALITVTNGFHGRLVYKNKRTGELFIWESYGDEQEMEMIDLQNAKATSKKFFENNWFIIKDPTVVSALGVEKYYKHVVLPENANDIFSLSPDEIKKEIFKLNKGQRESLKYFIREKILSGEIDSLSRITALEEALGVTFIERD